MCISSMHGCHRLYVFIFLFLIAPHLLLSQSKLSYGDSLAAELKKLESGKMGEKVALSDTAIVKVIIPLSLHMRNEGKFPRAVELTEKAQNICEKLLPEIKGEQRLWVLKMLAMALNNQGIALNYQGNYALSLQAHFKALSIREEIGDEKAIGASHNNIGLVYDKQGMFDKAISHYSRALAISKKLNDKKGIAHCLNNMAGVFAQQGENEKAMKRFEMVLRLKEELNDQKGIANTLGNIGNVYSALADSARTISQKKELYEKSLEYMRRSAAVTAGDKLGQCIRANEAGLVYMNLALISSGNERRQNISSAENFLKKSLSLSGEMLNKDQLAVNYHARARLDSLRGDFKNAMRNFRVSALYHDSLRNEENTRLTVQSEMNYQFAKREEAGKIEQAKKDAEMKAENAREKNIRNLFVAAFCFVMLLSFFIFRSYRQKQKANLLISQQKQLLEVQKNLVEEKQRLILDSINYAQRIQSSILPDENLLRELFGESFIFFKPRDIVSGDFFWFHKMNEESVVVAADCTGHGVPGAFLSMVGSTLLNEIVVHKNITNSAKIVKELAISLAVILRKGLKDEELSDGMDISVITYNHSSRELIFSGANQPIYIGDEKGVRKIENPLSSIHGILDLLSSDKIDSLHFTLEKNSCVYLSTDGVTDQAGGGAGKKYLSSRLLEFLNNNYKREMKEQKNLLEKEISEWKGNWKQTDDILVIGIRT